MIIQTTKTSRAGGHTQPNTSRTASDPNSNTRPATAKNTAGAAAQRCGWLLNRTDSTASNAQPRAKARSTTPVSTFSFAGMNGAATSARAATSPAANDAETINPGCPRGVCSGAPGSWRSRSWVVVVMMASNQQGMDGACGRSG